MNLIIKRIHDQRNALSDCGRDLFKGTETIEEIAELFRTPQGAEFCENHNFPDIETWRELNKAYDLSQFGVYVDAGKVSLINGTHVTLVGNTEGDLQYDTLERHTVTLMHRAKATVKASGWAVVFINHNEDCEVIKDVKDRAKIL